MQVRKFVNDVSLLLQIIVILVKKKDLNILLEFFRQLLPLLTCEQQLILYVMDISEQCGHTLEEQIELFNGIRPLFANKPLLVILNKIDVLRPDELSEEKKELIKVFDQEGNILLDLHNIAVLYHAVVQSTYFTTVYPGNR